MNLEEKRQQLRAELNKVNREINDQERKRREQYAARMLALAPSLLDVLFPEHDPNCDGKAVVYVYAGDRFSYSCERCWLQQVIEQKHWPECINLEINLNMLDEIPEE